MGCVGPRFLGLALGFTAPGSGFRAQGFGFRLGAQDLRLRFRIQAGHKVEIPKNQAQRWEPVFLPRF